MKKIGLVVMMVSALFVFGCGPKGASTETLNALSSAKTAAESAEAKIKDIEKERIKLEEEKAEKEKMVKSLEQELEALKTKQ